MATKDGGDQLTTGADPECPTDLRERTVHDCEYSAHDVLHGRWMIVTDVLPVGRRAHPNVAEYTHDG